MPNTKITKDKLKTHWIYSKWIYILVTLLVVGLASIMYTVVNNHNPPDDQFVGIAIVSSYTDTSRIEAETEILYERGKAYDPNLKKVEFVGISYSGREDSGSELDRYGVEVYIAQLAAGDNDVYIQIEALMKARIDDDTLKPLETLDSFGLIKEKYPHAIVWTDKEIKDDEGEVAFIETHCYYLDMSSLTRFNEKSAFSVDGMYACVMNSSANADTALYTLYQIFELFTPAEAVE